MGEMITFKSPDGKEAPGYEAKPAGVDAAPGIVVIQEWWGINDQIQKVAARFVQEGYRVVIPDLFRGKVTLDEAEASHLMQSLDFADAATQDVRGAAMHLKAEGCKKVGITGFCMGGALSLFAASKNAEVGACVVFYGGHPHVKPDLRSLKAPVLGLYAEKDGFVTPAVVTELDTRLTALGKRHEFHTYPGVDHAFFNDERPDVYDEEAAADAWARAEVSACIRG